MLHPTQRYKERINANILFKKVAMGKKDNPNKSKLASFNFNSKLKTLKP